MAGTLSESGTAGEGPSGSRFFSPVQHIAEEIAAPDHRHGRLVELHSWQIRNGRFSRRSRKSRSPCETAAGYQPTDIGTDLKGKAFNTSTGPLADMTLPEAERRAMLALFSGAVGLFKNPSSHRHVALNDPQEAAEMISYASLLMRIVDIRVALKQKTPAPNAGP
jgi:hypothetical protein